MGKIKEHWLAGALLMLIIIVVPLWLFLPGSKTVEAEKDPWSTVTKNRVHLDHKHFFTKPFERPQDVTLACLECHADAANDIMKTAHWKWESQPVKIEGHSEPAKIGKKNLINNFCIGIRGNWASCTICHIGYGWGDESFDFHRQENVDCLICHDWSGTYVKGSKGLPAKGVDLLAAAKQVGYPRRDNCGICHIYGGGGMGVKHGDLDNTLVNPSDDLDVHMGKHNLLCIDCHKTEKHDIKGKAFSVSVDHQNGITCTGCHEEIPHKDRRINTHLSSIACQTCHIPSYARKAATKTDWDWSKAGDPNRPDDPHEYLKIKGEFIYGKNIIPEYFWFKLKSRRYLLGDKIDPGQVTVLNDPLGDIRDKKAKIWPFKIHRAKQPFDSVNNYLLQPITSGKGGYWTEFDWDKALRLGAKATGIQYSGQYGFAETHMYWPLSHMVAPTRQALTCTDCHGEKGRMNWQALGYKDDPEKLGGRFHDHGNHSNLGVTQ